MRVESEIVVVGAGIIGASIALRLQAEGHAVRLIDRGAPGRGASYGNMACIAITEVLPLSRPSTWRNLPRWLLDREGPVHVRPNSLIGLSPWLLRFMRAGLPKRREQLARAGGRLCHRATRDFLELLSISGSSDLLAESRGALRIYLNPGDAVDDDDYLTSIHRLGFEYRRLSRDEVIELEPQVSAGIFGGALLPQWLLVKNPYELTERIVSSFVARGGSVQQAEVTGFASDSGMVRRVKLSGGMEVPAGKLVLACGAWTGRLAKQLRDTIPLETERGYHTQVADPGVTLSHALVIPGSGYVIAPVAGGIRIGGTVELGGLEAPPNYQRAKILAQRARNILPGLNFGNSTEWMGNRPALPDTIPLIGRATHFENVFYATGHGHLGLTLAATTSVLMSELISEKELSMDIADFGVGRF